MSGLLQVFWAIMVFEDKHMRKIQAMKIFILNTSNLFKHFTVVSQPVGRTLKRIAGFKKRFRLV